MRRVARFTRLSIVLLLPLLSGFAWGQYIGVPGPGPVAPVPDVPESSTLSEEQPEPPPHIHPYDLWQATQPPALAIEVPPGEIQEDQSASDDAFTLRASFSGIDMTPGSGAFAADPTIGVGPTHLLLGTNDSVAIQDKTGMFMASIDLRTFFSAVKHQGQSVYDPRVVFDHESNRFFIAAVGEIRNPCALGTCVSHFFLAVSKTSSPTTLGSGDWYFYAFDATLDGATPTTNFADFTGLGADDTVVVLTAKMVSLNDSSLQTLKIRILDKSKLIRGEAVTWRDFVGFRRPDGSLMQGAFQPAIHYESPGTFFLLSPEASSQCGLSVWGIANPLSNPTLSNHDVTAVSGGTCDVPPDAAQPNGGPPLNTGSNGLHTSPKYRNGFLWATQSVARNFGSGSVSAIRWVQIDTSAWPNSVSFTQDSVLGIDGVWHFYPDITVDALNNVTIVFGRSSVSEFASVYYTGRLSTDPPNTLRPSILLKAGTATLNQIPDSGRGGIFYGDYFGIALDPSDGSFWMLGEYAKASDAWGTWVGNVAIPVGIKAAFEGPETGPVSDVAVIRGWAFAMQPGVSISKVELFIDGVSAGDIPCCSDRADVQAAFPQFPTANTLNSGWGTTFNWGVLSAGSYTMQVVIKNTLGETLATETRMVTVIKPGNFEFLDQFSLSGATARIEGDQLVVEGAVVRDKASQQQKTINARFRWFISSQSLQTVEAVTTATLFSLRSFFAEMIAFLSARLMGLPVATNAQASPGIVRSFESPEANQVVSGVAVIRGWAFADTPGASLNEVRLVLDGMPSSSIPCCSARGDVAAAFPANPNALNSGWGFTINYGNLPAGSHTLGIRLGDSTGASLTDNHGVTVVKIGGFAFLDQFNLASATARIEGEDIVISGVRARDKASQQRKTVEVRLHWFQSSQALGIVASAG